jgi:hypothetical protein
MTTLTDWNKKIKERFFFINSKEYNPFLDADSGSANQELIYCERMFTTARNWITV